MGIIKGLMEIWPNEVCDRFLGSIPIERGYLVSTIRCLTPTPSPFGRIRRFIEGETEDNKNRKEFSQGRMKLSNYN